MGSFRMIWNGSGRWYGISAIIMRDNTLIFNLLDRLRTRNRDGLEARHRSCDIGGKDRL
jgi:hypothetical protein